MKTQNGYGGIRVFRAPPLHRGYGIGRIFKGLFRTVSSFIKKGLLQVDDVSKDNTTFKGVITKKCISTSEG